MDENTRFDDLARIWGSRISRRRAVRLTVGTIAGMMLGSFEIKRASATIACGNNLMCNNYMPGWKCCDCVINSFHNCICCPPGQGPNQGVCNMCSASYTCSTCQVDCSVSGPQFSYMLTNGGNTLIVTQQDANGYLSNEYTGSDNVAIVQDPVTTGQTTPFQISFTRLDLTRGAEAEITATDESNCTNFFDPLYTSALRAAGEPRTDSYSGIRQSEGHLTILNASPGVTHMVITVNATSYKVDNLKDNEQRSLNVAAALQAGNNAVSITTYGKPGGSAVVIAGPR